MKVKLTQDFMTFKANTVQDLDSSTVALLVKAQACEPPSDESIRNDAVKQAMQEASDPLLQKMNQLIDRLAGVDAGKRPGLGKTGEVDGTLGFSRFGEQLVAIAAANMGQGKDVRLVGQGGKFSLDEHGHIKLTAGHMGESVDSAGGFLVAPDFRMEVMRLALPQSIVRQRAFVIPTKSDTLYIPKLDGQDMSGGMVHGGVVGYWPAEGVKVTPSRGALGRIELKIKDLCGLTFSSLNLLRDSAIALEAFLTEAFSSALAYFEDQSFFIGSGAARPQGFLNCPAMYKQTRKTTNKIQWVDIVNMFSRMYIPSMSRGCWVAHPSVLPEIMQMAQNTGTSAPLVWIGAMPVGETNLPPIALVGKPLLWSPFCPTLGNSGDIGYYDFKHYLVADRQELMLDSSEHVAFESREVAWMFTQRMDGQVWLVSTIKDAQGYECSPFVRLENTQTP